MGGLMRIKRGNAGAKGGSGPIDDDEEMAVSTMSLPPHATASSGPLRTGVALAATVAVFYAACALVWLAAPTSFMAFMNNLFHGMDFTTLLKPAAFSPIGFVSALAVMSLWAFLAGTFFAWLRQRLG